MAGEAALNFNHADGTGHGFSKILGQTDRAPGRGAKIIDTAEIRNTAFEVIAISLKQVRSPDFPGAKGPQEQNAERVGTVRYGQLRFAGVHIDLVDIFADVYI